MELFNPSSIHGGVKQFNYALFHNKQQALLFSCIIMIYFIKQVHFNTFFMYYVKIKMSSINLFKPIENSCHMIDYRVYYVKIKIASINILNQ